MFYCNTLICHVQASVGALCVFQIMLEVGLGVQLNHHFASKFLIDSSHKHGYCCSYSEVMTCVRSAAVTQAKNIPGFRAGHFVQCVADNVEHKARTIDGMNTFHGMGIIAATTPATQNNQHVPRFNVTAEDISANGTVNIVPFLPVFNGIQSLSYDKLQITEKDDPTSVLDNLWKLSLSVRSPRPAWSGMMQMILIHTGDHPGQASVWFFNTHDRHGSW